MKSKFTVYDIALRNVKSRIYRSGIMAFFIFVLSAALFTCTVMLTSMEGGIRSTSERLGADIVAVPSRYYSSIENALFTGEPCTVYFDKEWTELLRELDGVEKTSSQLFLATLNADCCESQAQLIAFDESNDFVIKPWINKNVKKTLSENEVVVGKNIGLDKGDTVTYYGVEFEVAGVLDESGMGYDHSAFVNYDGAKRIINSESARNFLTVKNDDFISMVNIKVKDGYDAEQISNILSDKYDEIAVYTANKMLDSVEKSVGGFSVYSKIISIILIILSIIAVMSIFSITINERKREFGIFILFGASKKQLISIILIEAAIIIIAGTLAGILVSGTVLFAFDNFIALKIQLPYLTFDFGGAAAIALKCALITFGVGIVSALYSVINITKSSGADLLKEGE